MKHTLKIASLLLALTTVPLTSCSYTMDGTLQEITFETPGAENAVCYMKKDRIMHKILPPQSIVLNRSNEDMYVLCYAPGNRSQSTRVKAEVLDSTILNIGNGILPGIATDYITGAMFIYPDTVSIDFTGIHARPNGLPSYHASDVLPPMKKGLEEFRPMTPDMSYDSDTPWVVQKKVEEDYGEMNGLWLEDDEGYDEMSGGENIQIDSGDLSDSTIAEGSDSGSSETGETSSSDVSNSDNSQAPISLFPTDR